MSLQSLCIPELQILTIQIVYFIVPAKNSQSHLHKYSSFAK